MLSIYLVTRQLSQDKCIYVLSHLPTHQNNAFLLLDLVAMIPITSYSTGGAEFITEWNASPNGTYVRGQPNCMAFELSMTVVFMVHVWETDK
jgi:hypothetical protein